MHTYSFKSEQYGKIPPSYGNRIFRICSQPWGFSVLRGFGKRAWTFHGETFQVMGKPYMFFVGRWPPLMWLQSPDSHSSTVESFDVQVLRCSVSKKWQFCLEQITIFELLGRLCELVMRKHAQHRSQQGKVLHRWLHIITSFNTVLESGSLIDDLYIWKKGDVPRLFTPLRVGWPPTPQVYFGPWEGLRVVFPRGGSPS